MVCDMVLVQVGYDMGFPYHGIGMSGGWYGFSIPWVRLVVTVVWEGSGTE